MSKEIDEKMARKVHKAYCDWYKLFHGESYWTKGNYDLLDDKVKEADLYTVRACKAVILEEIEKKVILVKGTTIGYMTSDKIPFVEIQNIRKLLGEK